MADHVRSLGGVFDGNGDTVFRHATRAQRSNNCGCRRYDQARIPRRPLAVMSPSDARTSPDAATSARPDGAVPAETVAGTRNLQVGNVHRVAEFLHRSHGDAVCGPAGVR